ncbi:MAG: sigma-70 family RNA polymerase sigma factor [Planctomycetaceae bacterium]|jgi:RNA polymerase sigma-70 factor (ECF subfamily)|nr:sigma-70 family RNA polymerase sigma factor [Planctomycetaceae bacterium]
MLRTATETLSVTTCDWSDWTDEDLLVEYRCTGQRDAFEELVHRYERELFAYLYHYLRNAAAAEDTFQKTFMQVWQQCSRFDETREFRPWLYRIATNLAIDHCRRAKNNPAMSAVSIDDENENTEKLTIAETICGKEPIPDEEASERELVFKVRDAVAQLPDHLRQAVYMVYFQGLTYREAAESAGVHFATLSGRVKSAIEKLNRLLKNAG